VGDGETSAQGREHALHGAVFGVDGNVTGLAARHRHVREDEVALSNYFVYSEDQLREGRAQPQGRCVEARMLLSMVKKLRKFVTGEPAFIWMPSW